MNAAFGYFFFFFFLGEVRSGISGHQCLWVIVPRECVTDRAKDPHEANLFDIQMKLGDVVGIEEVLTYLASQPRPPA